MQREGNPVRDLLCVNTYKLLNPRKDKEEIRKVIGPGISKSNFSQGSPS